MVIRGLQGMAETVDALIVGGGSAGAVLAKLGSAYSSHLYPPDLPNADIGRRDSTTTGAELQKTD